MRVSPILLPADSIQALELPLGPEHRSVPCYLLYAHAATVAQARAQVMGCFGATVLGRPEQVDWPIHRHAYLQDAPQWMVSLSHTRLDAVFVASAAEGLRGWGVDIESTQRRLHRNPAQRVAHSQDASMWCAQPLAHWTLKEAVFKAADSSRALLEPQRPSPLLSELVIGETSWYWSVDRSYRGACTVLQLHAPESPLWCALATTWN